MSSSPDEATYRLDLLEAELSTERRLRVQGDQNLAEQLSNERVLRKFGEDALSAQVDRLASQMLSLVENNLQLIKTLQEIPK